MASTPQQLLADAQARISELLRASPAADIERNLKALLAQTFQKLELVTREEFEVERERLDRLQRRLDTLERELDAREPRAGAPRAVQDGADASGVATPGAASNPFSTPGSGSA